MSEISKVNPQVLAAVWETQKAVNAPKVVWENSAGKAFQFVAQATAMAVQDATDNLRNISTISTTAIGMAMSQLMSSGDVETWQAVISAAQNLVQTSANDLLAICQNASQVLQNFPAGPPPGNGTTT